MSVLPNFVFAKEEDTAKVETITARMVKQFQLLFILWMTIQVFTKRLVLTNAEDVTTISNTISISTTTTTVPPPVIICQSPIDLTVDSSWLETVVFGEFRIWHIIFTGLAIFTGITVILCCFFRCRIPRTKQEIEADDTRKKITKVINAHLKKIKLDELQYDPANLLPVIKRVEDLEEDRVQKHRTFRRLNWRQKLKRLITGKDASFEDDTCDDHKGDDQTMTKEEMEKVEQEVESAKIDSTAFNVITDQIAVLSYFESDKTRKKRLKEEKKEKKKLEKEQKKQEKAEKKKQKKMKGEKSDDPKEPEKMVELKAATLEKDLKKDPKTETEKPEPSSPSPELTIDMPAGEEEPDETPSGKKSRFSFRGAVMGLMTRGFRRSEPKPPPSPVREAMVINIELVSKQPTTPTDEIGTVVIPQIEVPDDGIEDIEKPKKSKHKNKLTKMKTMDKNRLHIPEVSLKETSLPKSKKKDDKKSPEELSEDRIELMPATDLTEQVEIESEKKKLKKKKTKDKKEKHKIEDEKPPEESEVKKESKKEHKAKKKEDQKMKKEKEKSEKKKSKDSKKVIFVPEPPGSLECIEEEIPIPVVSEPRKRKAPKPGLVKKSTTSSSSIEIPVEHFYSATGPIEPIIYPSHGPHKTVVQVHRQQHRISPSPEVPRSLPESPQPSTSSQKQSTAFEQSTTVERMAAGAGDQRQELTIEKTRNVMFDITPHTVVTFEPPKSTKKVVKLKVDQDEREEDTTDKKHKRKHRKKSP